MAAPFTSRLSLWGWEHGGFYQNSPSDGNITVQSGSARTGNYGVKFNCLSAVNSYYSLPTNTQTGNDFFFRTFIKFDSFPSTRRVFMANQPNVNSVVRYGLAINPTGVVDFVKGTGVGSAYATVSTFPTTLVTGRWYMLEWGNVSPSAYKFKLDGNTELDWFTPYTTPSDVYIGALDTQSAAFVFHIDDAATDGRDFCGYGRVKAMALVDVMIDSANWVVTGAADKVSAVDVLASGWTDASYIDQTNAAQTGISFGFGPFPDDCVVCYGMRSWFRVINITGGPVFYPGWAYRGRGSGAVSAFSTAHSISGQTTAAFSLQSNVLVTRVSPFGHFWSEEFWDDLGVSLIAQQNIRCSGILVEIDYSDRSDARTPDDVNMLCDFESSVAELTANSNGSTSGTVNVITTDAKFGSGCAEVVHASGGHSNMRAGSSIGLFRSASVFQRHQTVSVWVKVPTAPSNNFEILFGYDIITSNLQWSVFISPTGQVRINAHASWGGNGTFTTTTPFPFGQWVHVAVEWYPPTLASSSLDGICRVWINDDLVVERTDMGANTNGVSNTCVHYGALSNITGGATVRYDGVCEDWAVRHTSHLKILTLRPNGVGARVGTGFVAVGVTDKWDALNDVTPDDDATYVTMGTTNNAVDSYTTNDLPANAVQPLHYVGVFRRQKMNAAGTPIQGAGISWTLPVIGIKSNTSSSQTAGAAYGFSSQYASIPLGIGRLTPALLNAMELALVNQSASAVTRVTQLWAVVAYTSINDRGPNRSGSSVIVG